MSSEGYSSESSSSSRQSATSDSLSAELSRMDSHTGRGQEAGSSGQGSRVDLSDITRGAWKGSDMTQHEIDWLYRSRRIPAGVSYRLLRGEIEPVLEPGESVVFLAHFERGFGLPASDFFREFLDFYGLRPHHLPGNAVFYLSCYVSFMEGYIGLRPTKETFACFFSLRINSVQGKDIPKPKLPVQCGSCIIGSHQGSPFFKFSGLESCRAWQETFFYVKNTGDEDLMNLPAFNPAVPTKANWSFNPKANHIETNRIIRFMDKLKRETDISSDDIILTFISRRVLPLQHRAHKISEMYGPRDPTKITGLPLSLEDIVLKARQICQTDMPLDWEWGFRPLSSTNPPTAEDKERFSRIAAERRGPKQKRDLDEVDPDPYIHWTDFKIGRTHTPCPDAPSASTQPQVHEHVAPLQAEVGREYMEKLTSQGKKHKAPATEAGSSQGPPAKRSRTEVVGGKAVGKKRYQGKQMSVASGPALKLSKSASGPRPESSEGTARTSSPLHSGPTPSGAGNASASPLGGTPSAGRAAPTPPDHRAEEEHVSPPETQDTGASNIGADSEAAGSAEPQLYSGPDAPDAHSSPLPEAPTIKPTEATPTPPPSQGPSADEPAPTSSQGPAAAKPTLPPEGTKLLKPEPFKGKATASGTVAPGSQQLALHAGRAAVAAGETATGLLGQITELKRGGHELGHLLEYAEKWNRADVSAATRGLGKDRLPALDPAGPRCTEQHFIRLRRAVKELDNTWHDATNNVLSTVDARKRLFEELLWEHRDLSEAHSHCQAIPEASIEALKAQLSTLQNEKEQLIREHRKALDAQELVSRGLKDQLIQFGL
ncbi:hypothetical protein QYE76_045553 [Lolium multiflorum]|uniref:Transposase (putative) gypsy type domain-containing protein n=1 Tax=Lolium multiflorum TaxID=4521 RepID=A0AAD8WXT0_LOLMU|nr:hypothetical protein QYE76_045553 [Lolium multiflorum]